MIRPSLRRTPETASVKESAGLPWGCVLQPLAPTAETGGDERDDAIGAEEVPRCEECFGYINAYCMFERKAWICCLCGCKNELAVRYSSSSARAGLPEMQRGIVDLLEECIEVDKLPEPMARFYVGSVALAFAHIAGASQRRLLRRRWQGPLGRSCRWCRLEPTKAILMSLTTT